MEGIIGMIKMYVVDTPPADWMLCDGRLLPTADYPDLFAKIGHRFGGGGESFAIPRLDKDPAGYFLIRAQATPGQEAGYKGMVSQIVLYAGEDLPEGWLPCDGRFLDPAAYPVLNQVMGARFGTDDRGFIALPDFSAEGVVYIICVEGINPMPPEEDDDY